MEILIPKKNIVLDSQILSTLMSCPRLTDFRFNLNFRPMGGKSNSLEAGSLVHKILEYYYKSLINKFNRDLAIANGLTAGELYIRGCAICTDFVGKDPSCGHQPNEFPGLKNTPQESTNKPSRVGWQYVLKTCEEYFEFRKSDSWIPLECEVVKGEVLYEDDEIRILWKAKLDLVMDSNQGIFPVDHKSMKQNRDNISLNNQFIGQCLLIRSRTIWINKIGFQTSLEPKDKFPRIPISYSADRLIEWQSEILPYYAKLLLMYSESGYWPPNFTHCSNIYGNCEFKDVCEANRDMREEELKKDFIIGEKWDISNIEEE
jgi:hypothetical protein